MTLRDQISDDVTSVFLNEDDFATEVTWWPLGDASQATAVVGVVAEDGSPEEFVDTLGGRLVRRGILELSIDYGVTAHDSNRVRDAFLIGGEMWHATRIVGRDDHMQSVLIERQEPVGRPPA